MSVKNSDTIGNRTRDLPACSAVPQPIAPPRVPPEVFSTPTNPLPGQQLHHQLHKRNSIPDKDSDFPSSQCIQTGSMANLDSDPMTIAGLLPG
jgi:hypothetical protein